MKITEAALKKLHQLNTKGENLRIGIAGGGCSGFQYLMEFTSEPKQMLDQLTVYPVSKASSFSEPSIGPGTEYRALSVLIDSTSAMYLNDAVLDYLETLEESGFKFINPNVKTTCGCGKSFST